METSAAARFAGNQRLIVLLAKEIKSPYLLGALRRVNSLFRASVTHILFSRIHINGTRAHRVNSLVDSPLLQHVETLSVGSCQSRLDALNHNLRAVLLPRLPQVTAFWWLTRGLEKKTLHALCELCPKLTSLRVVTDPDEWYKLKGHWFYTEDDLAVQMPRFAGLDDLALYRLQGSFLEASELATLLRNNAPTLRSLLLSTLDAVTQDCLACRMARRSGHVKFVLSLDDVALLYQLPANDDPPREPLPRLALRHLTIGPGVTLPSHWAAGKLLDRLVLEELRLANCKQKLSTEYPYGYDLAVFDDTACPRLRAYSVGVMDTEVCGFLARREPAWTRQLAVVSAMQRGWSPLVQQLSDRFVRRQWRMLVVDLTRVCTDDDDDDEDGDVRRHVISLLAPLVRADEGSTAMQGMQLVVRKTQWRLLRLESVLAALASLAGLQQMVLDFTWVPMDGRYIPRFDPEGVALLLAQRITRLQYIRISSSSWRV
ncbi:hypothetical protein SCUCBS95973_000709 [Sporothrix curviconia]|uniref:F-box domain-containing protein n=1 Tax=Sporothrix curviconia TaxID=1260050 RepID=A0ABP0ASI2_9PEZI